MRIERILLITLLILGSTPVSAGWEEGDAAFRAGDLDVAEAEFRALVESQPEWPGGHLMLGQTLLRSGRSALAVPPLERALELNHDDLTTALVLGQTYLRLGHFGAAAEVLDGRDPAALPAARQLAFHKTRATAALRERRDAAALADLERAVALAPRDAELHRLLGRTAEKTGREELAIRHLEHAIELAPRYVETVRSLAGLLYDRAREAAPEERATVCGRAVPVARKLVALEGAYDHLVLHAEAARCAGLSTEARDSLALAAAARPGEWWPQYALGRAELRLESWSEAEAALGRALAGSVPESDLPRVAQQLGFVYEKQERFEEAIEQYRLAGDTVSVGRVQKNRQAQKEAELLRKLEEEKRQLEKEIEELEAASGL